MIDGSTYYNSQSQARSIGGISDVKRLAAETANIYDRILLKKLPNNRNAAIYEAATGPGILQAWLKNRCFTNLHGSDSSEKEAALAAQISHSIIQGDSVADLQNRFSACTFDAIIALDFYEHIPRERFRDFLRISSSRLNPEGILILRGPNADSPLVGLNLYNDITHIWAYTSTCLRVLCRLEGFQDVQFCDDAIPGLHHGAAWKTPLMRISQMILTQIVWMASRQRVQFWGSSIYIFARKGESI